MASITTLGTNKSNSQTFTITGVTASVGDYIIVCVHNPLGLDSVTLGGAGSGGATLTLTEAVNSGGGAGTYILYGRVLTAISNQTITVRSVSYMMYAHSATAYKVTGLLASAVLDKTATGTGNSNTATTSATATLSQENEVVIGAIGQDLWSSSNAGTWTTGDGYVEGNEQRDGTTANSKSLISSAAEVVSATTAQTARKTGLSSGSWNAAIATFKSDSATHSATATLGGTSELTASGNIQSTHNATANLGGTSALTAIGRKLFSDVDPGTYHTKEYYPQNYFPDGYWPKVGGVTHDGVATLGGTSTLTVAGQRNVWGATALSGSSALTVEGKRTANGSSFLSGTSDLTAVGERYVGASATLSGSSEAVAVGTRKTDNFTIEIDHEEGDLSDYTSTSGPVPGKIAVTPAAALNGSDYGLAASISDSTYGTATKEFDASTSPYVRVRFTLDPNSISMPSDGSANITLFSHSMSFSPVIRLGYSSANNGYYIYAEMREDLASFHQTPNIEITDAPHVVEVMWVKATTSTSNNSYLEIFVDGVKRSGLSGLDSYSRWTPLWYTTSIINAASGVISGTLYLDDIVLTNRFLASGTASLSASSDLSATAKNAASANTSASASSDLTTVGQCVAGATATLAGTSELLASATCIVNASTTLATTSALTAAGEVFHSAVVNSGSSGLHVSSQCDVVATRTTNNFTFEIDHESGDIAVYEIIGGTAFSNIAITPESALNGSNYGLASTLSGGNYTSVIKILDRSTSDYCRVRFSFDPNSISLSEEDESEVTLISVGSTINRCIKLGYRADMGGYYLMPSVDDDYYDTRYTVQPITDAPHVVEVQWVRATAVGASDGYIELYVDGRLLDRVSDIDTYSRWSEFVWNTISITPGRSGAVDGTLYFDDIVITNRFLASGAASLAASSDFSAVASNAAGANANVGASSHLTAIGQRSVNAAATLATNSSIAVSGQRRIDAATTLAASTILTSVGKCLLVASTSLGTSSTVDAIGRRTVGVYANMAGTSALSAGAKSTLGGSILLSGTSTLTASSRRTINGTVAAVGSSALTAVAKRTISVTATLADDSSLVTDGKRTVNASAALAATTTVAIIGQQFSTHCASSAIVVASAGLAIGKRAAGGKSSLPNDSVLVGAAKRTTSGQASLAAVAVIEIRGEGATTLSGACSLAGQSTLAVSGSALLSSQAALSALSATSVIGQAARGFAAQLTAAAEVLATGRALRPATASLVALSELQIVGSIASETGVFLAVTTEQTVAAHVTLGAKVSLAGAGDISVIGKLAHDSHAQLLVTSNLQSAGATKITAQASLSGSSELQAGSSATVLAHASLYATGAQDASAKVTRGAVGHLAANAESTAIARSILGCTASMAGDTVLETRSIASLSAAAAMSASISIAIIASATTGVAFSQCVELLLSGRRDELLLVGRWNDDLRWRDINMHLSENGRLDSELPLRFVTLEVAREK